MRRSVAHDVEQRSLFCTGALSARAVIGGSQCDGSSLSLDKSRLLLSGHQGDETFPDKTGMSVGFGAVNRGVYIMKF